MVATVYIKWYYIKHGKHQIILLSMFSRLHYFECNKIFSIFISYHFLLRYKI